MMDQQRGPVPGDDTASTVESARRAWQEYVVRGVLRPDLLRPTIFRGWERSHLAGADPGASTVERISVIDAERRLARARPLLVAASPYMRALSYAAGHAAHAATIADADAVLLDMCGDEATQREAVIGGVCSEEALGTNGIGTTLAEGAYTEIIGPEHFMGCYRDFSCQGVPLRDPMAPGETLGVLVIARRSLQSTARFRDLLVCAANGVEAELLRGKLDDDLRALDATSEPSDTFLERLRQDVVQAQTAGRLRIEQSARYAAKSRREEAMELVTTADRLSRTFQRRARIWRALASHDRGPRVAVSLARLAGDLMDLLETEARMRAVQVGVHVEGEPIVEAEPRALCRELLRLALDAMSAAGPGGEIDVGVSRLPRATSAQVTFTPTSPARGVALPLCVRLPLAPSPLVP